MQFTSTFVRYERRGDRVVPVRVTKAWVTREGSRDNRKEPVVTRAFKSVRVSEVPWRHLRDREPALEADGQPAKWQSYHRVPTRERLHTLVVQYQYEEGGLPVAWPSYMSTAPFLALGEWEPSLARSQWTVDNGNGWMTWNDRRRTFQPAAAA